MSLADLANYKKPTTTKAPTKTSVGLSSLADFGKTKPRTGKVDLQTQEGLTTLAEQKGLGAEAQKIVGNEPKLSFLQRLGKGLGAFNPAEAILTGKEQGLLAGIKKYPEGIIEGIGSAFTGTDYEGERRSYKDVVAELGVDNKIAQAGIGFLGDVFLDPSTYFGPGLIKGLAKGTSIGVKAGLSGLEKVSPETAEGLKMVGTGLQDAIGRAFQYGYKATEGAREDVLNFLSKEGKAKLGIAASNLDRLGTGILTDAQRKELALKLIAGKRAEFVARDAGKTAEEAGAIGRETAQSADPIVQKTIEEQIARSQKIGEQVTENPYEVYFPFIKNTQIQKFVNETKGIRVGSEGYRKQFKNLLTNENIELDPAKAFFTRESQIVSDRMTRDFLTGFVEKYGKGLDVFKDSDEAAKAGFQLIKEKGMFGKELGYVPEFDAKLLRDSISPEFQTVNMLAKATGFDVITSLFKRSVTGLFAPFHVRNFMSGQIQNFEALGIQALNPRNIAIGQKIAYLMGKGEKFSNELIEVAGKKMKFSQLIKPFADRFSGDTFYNADFNLALKNGGELKSVAGIFSKQRLKETAKTAGLGTEAIPFKVGRAIGQYIEHQQKATAYITALEQGKSIPEAIKLAEVAGFDYRALTKFESQIMRRLIPFYSFTRKNLELQLKTLGENPQRINQILSFFENVSAAGGLTDEERAGLPDYLQEQLTLSFGKNKQGQPIVAGGFGTPVEQPGSVLGKGFADSIRRIAATLNPLIKTPLEKAFGKDFFQDRPISEIVDAKQYQILPDYIKEFIGFKEVEKDTFEKNKYGRLVKTGKKTTYTADPEKLHILRNLPTTRLFGYLYEIYRPEDETIGGAKALNLLTGVKPKPIDLETIKYFRDRDRRRELEDLLLRTGVLKEFKNTYAPK